MKLNRIDVKEAESPAQHHKDKDCLVNRVLKPILWLMRLSAVIYTEKDPRSECSCWLKKGLQADSIKQNRYSMPWKCLQLTYIFLTHTAVLTHTIKIVYCTASTTHHDDRKLQFEIILALAVASSNVILPVALVQFSKQLVPFLQCICALRRKHGIDIVWISKKLDRFVLGCVFCVCISLLAIGAMVPSIKDTMDFFDVLYEVMSCSFRTEISPLGTFLFYWMSIVASILIMSITLVTLLFVGFCNTSCCLFDECCKWLRAHNTNDIKDSVQERSNSLKEIFLFHQNVCDVVKQGNDLFKYLLISIYTMTIPSICFGINVLTKSPVGSGLWIGAIIDTSTMLSFLLFIAAKAVSINTKSLELLDEIFNIQPVDPIGKDIHLVSLFAAKLSNSSTGLSPLGLFLITKGHIMTLLSILLTYTLIIVQLDPASLQRGDHSNSTL